MQVKNQPNKFEIFQHYYLYVNGEMISYSEALRLYSQLDADTKLDFEKFYKDETGYEIISSTGYGLDSTPELKVDENGKLIVKSTKTSSNKKSVKTKKDGKIEWTKAKKTVNTYETTSSASKTAALDIKYSIEAYAKKTGKILDPQWSGYSAEEIMQMYNDGVNIPQDIVDLANSILQTTSANLEGSDENPDGAEETTEKEPYLDLIPKAKKKIEKCNDTNEKISDKIDALLPEKQKKEKDLKNKMKEQKDSLREYEDQLREWRRLQEKINHGEALSDSEAKKYAQITGMLEDRNNKDDIQFDKKEITRSLNDLNIWAILGEKLADETIEIGDTLADYTSETNYKTTSKTVSHEIGFIGTIMAMAQGKNLAQEANKIGHDTKEYTSDATNSVTDIASILGVENAVVSKDEVQNHNIDELFANPDAKAQDVLKEQDENSPEAEEEIKTPETTAEEDFIVNDKNVSDLIKEAGHTHSDMTGQAVKALKNSTEAKSDKKFAKSANYKIARIIKQYQSEEEKREAEIAKLEQENKEAKDKLEKLTGKSGDELDKEINNSADKEEDKNNGLSESDKKEVEKLKSTVQSNNQRIAELRETSDTSIDEFKNRTTKEKARISSSVPKENQELEANTEYQEKIIPQAKEDLSFTDNSGETLAKMGKYRITVGLKQIAALQLRKGYKNVTKGAVSAAIGLGAEITGSIPTPQIAEKSTKSAIKNETSAIEGLNQADAMISSITGEETTQSAYDANKNATQDKTAGNAEEGAKDSADGMTSNVSAPEVETNASSKTAPAQNVDTTTGAAAPLAENGSDVETENKVEASTTVDVQKVTTKATKTVSNGEKETSAQKEEENVVKKASDATTSTSSSKNSNKKEEMTDEKAQDNVDKTNASAKDSSKDSENVKKDTDKTTKQLEKETKTLTKQMKRDEKEIIKMTKESEKAAKKQEEMVAEYEAIVAENEQLTTADIDYQRQNQTQNQNKAQVQSANSVAQVNPEEVQNQSTTLGSTAAQEDKAQTPNADKIASNDARLNEIGVDFELKGKVITRNRTKITKLEKSTKATQKKVTKKTKVIEEKNKEAEKKEQDKQKKLAKQLGVVGIAENQFSITLSTGTILLLSPWTHAVGQVMVNVGTYGIAACGVTKATINLANGNLTAALMSIGQSAITVVSSQVGLGSAAGGVLGAVTAGLNVVASSADMVNNVRAVQGKEASGVFSKISAIAGAASAVTSAASTIGSLGQSGTFGQIAKIGSVVGSAMSSTSQLMSSFGGDSKAASLLGAIGGIINMAASVGMIADAKMNQASEKNKENKDQANSTEGTDNSDNIDNNENSNKINSDENKTEGEKTKEEQAKETEEKKALAEIKNAEQNVNAEQTNSQTDDKSKETIKQVENEKTPKEQLKEAKAARDAQKEEAKNSGLSKDEKKNMKENGASKEYANVSDEELAEQIEYYQGEGNNTAKADELSNEMAKRGDYKDKMAVIADNKAKTRETVSKVMDAAGNAITAASSLISMNSGNKNQKRKKGYVAANLTKRSKEIIKKNKKRVAALAKKKNIA